MKSKDQISGDETSDAEGECQRRLLFLSFSPNFPNPLLTTLVLTYHDEKNNHYLFETEANHKKPTKQETQTFAFPHISLTKLLPPMRITFFPGSGWYTPHYGLGTTCVIYFNVRFASIG